MKLSEFSSLALPEVEAHLQRMVTNFILADYVELRKMFIHHLGWKQLGDSTSSGGKRIRPLLILLCNEACRGDWRETLPAASAVELIHNFSLIHDDIQDNSPMRRGKEAVWVKWGIPQAINAGDLMFTVGHLSMLELIHTHGAEVAHTACTLLLQRCNMLTQGQYLDIAYETRSDVTLEDYWQMISGKTAALIGCCTELGALLARVDEPRRSQFGQYGEALGLAFQVQDDWLGIWGETAQTGKTTDSDLVAGKKTLPILFGLHHGGKFAQRWKEGPITTKESKELADLLVEEGAKQFTENMVKSETDKALKLLYSAVPEKIRREPLEEMTEFLLRRNK